MTKFKPNKSWIIKSILPLSIFICTNILSFIFNGYDDAMLIVKWWLYLFIIGLVFLPFSTILFNKFHDNGWIVSKILCISVCGWLMFTTSSLRLLKFTQFNCVLMLAFAFILNIIGYIIYTKKSSNSISLLKCYSEQKVFTIIKTEVIFYFLLVFMGYIRGNCPDIFGTERFMDYGFMLSIYKSDYMPVQDPWLAGMNLNYYYLGQYLMTYLCKITGIFLPYSYNLVLIMLFAMCFLVSYSIGNNLMRLFITYKSNYRYSKKELDLIDQLGTVTKENNKSTLRPFLTGLVTAISIACGATCHYPIFKYIIPKIQHALNIEDIYTYWFADSTRFIGGFYPDKETQIHEFPSYSFFLGDLHAHVINTIFVLLLLSLIIAWVINKKQQLDISQLYNKSPKMPSILKEVFNPYLICCACLTGLFKGTNYWDFPIYFVVSGAIILFVNIITYRYKFKALWLTAIQGIMFFVVGYLVGLPFMLNFNMISSKLALVNERSYQWELAVAWGLPNLILWSFIIYMIVQTIKHRTDQVLDLPINYKNDVIKEPQIIEEVDQDKEDTSKPKKSAKIIQFVNRLTPPDLIVVIFGLCAFGLVLLPEFVHVVDIYADGESRSNTMFKLTYQAYILFGISTTYIVMRYIILPTSKFIKGFGIICLCIIISTFGYFNEAWCAFNDDYHKGLDGTIFFEKNSTADREVVDYINSTFTEPKVVIENFGIDFSYFSRISAFTGMPTVIGWTGHEYLWMWDGNIGELPIIDSRIHDVIRLYTAKDKTQAAHIVEKYNIEYIYIGPCEKVNPYIRYEGIDIDNNPDLQDKVLFINGYYYQRWDIDIPLLMSLGKTELKVYDEQSQSYCYLIKVNRDYTAELNKDWVFVDDEWVSHDPRTRALEEQ